MKPFVFWFSNDSIRRTTWNITLSVLFKAAFLFKTGADYSSAIWILDLHLFREMLHCARHLSAWLVPLGGSATCCAHAQFNCMSFQSHLSNLLTPSSFFVLRKKTCEVSGKRPNDNKGKEAWKSDLKPQCHKTSSKGGFYFLFDKNSSTQRGALFNEIIKTFYRCHQLFPPYLCCQLFFYLTALQAMY